MIEGLWSVEFATGYGSGLGIAVFESQRILGGDVGRTYIGDYKTLPNQIVSATVKISKFSDHAPESVFADHEDFELQLEGVYDSEKFTMRGYRDGDSSILIEITFTKRADLP